MRLVFSLQGIIAFLSSHPRTVIFILNLTTSTVFVVLGTKFFNHFITAKSKRNELCEQCNHSCLHPINSTVSRDQICFLQRVISFLNSYPRTVIFISNWITSTTFISIATNIFNSYLTAKSKRNEICQQCNHLNPTNITSASRYQFQFVNDNEDRTFLDCKYCQFVLDAISSFVRPVASGPESGEVWSAWFRSNREIGLLALVAVEETEKVKRVQVQIFSTNDEPPDPAQRLPKRLKEISPRGDSENSFTFARKLLDLCRNHHVECSKRDDRYHPTRLIHIISNDRLQLVEGEEIPEGVEYSALSYCWGSGRFFMTTHSNFDNLRQGFAVSALPGTLSDAVKVTATLGLEFIWIDALCIIQGDVADWNRESPLMAQVYANAHVTIGAASAGSVEEGFLHPRKMPDRFTRTWTNSSGNTISLSARLQPASGFHAMRLTPSGHDEMEASKHRDPTQVRGWTFQEQILSRRFLNFSRDEVQWACRCITTCECRACHLEIDCHPIPSRHLLDCPFHAWGELVALYTQRRLSFAKDKLPALSGIAHTVQDLTGSEYVAGIWLDDIANSLNGSRKSQVHPETAYGGPKPCPDTYRAPSFSWASIDDAVSCTAMNPTNSGDVAVGQITVLGWTAEPVGTDLLGEVKPGASLELSGIVHDDALLVTDDDESPGTLSVHFANRTVVMEEDTPLIKFEFVVKNPGTADSEYAWSACRFTGTSDGNSEWLETLYRDNFSEGVPVTLLYVGPTTDRPGFLVLGKSPGDPTRLERLGVVDFSFDPFREEVDTATKRAWEAGAVDERWRRRIVLV